jgi:aryl-alcohol dehydrogenase-like predicted oxidoreductase
MKMRFLGKTGLQVSELCLGTGTFGGLGTYKKSGEVSQKEADLIVAIALDSDINFFNTAEIYSDGLAETILGKALGNRRKNAIIISKVHPTRNQGANDGGHSRKHIIEACEASLKRLGTDYIDLYELHGFDEDTPLEITLRVLDDLVRQGKVRYFGCSNYTGWQLMKGLSISDKNHGERFMTLEAMYSLMSREIELELVPLCLDQGIAILAFSPLYGGYLSGKYRRDQPWPTGTRFSFQENSQPWPIELENLYRIIDELDRIGKENNVTVAQAALNYLLCKPGVSSLIFAVKTPQQLEENLKATNWEMMLQDVILLDRLSEPKRKYPYFVHDPVKASKKRDNR